MTLAHVLETISVKIHQNRPSRLGCRADTDTDTQTDRRTDTHIHPRCMLTYSVKMTEYKNEHLTESHFVSVKVKSFN